MWKGGGKDREKGEGGNKREKKVGKQKTKEKERKREICGFPPSSRPLATMATHVS